MLLTRRQYTLVTKPQLTILSWMIWIKAQQERKDEQGGPSRDPDRAQSDISKQLILPHLFLPLFSNSTVLHLISSRISKNPES